MLITFSTVWYLAFEAPIIHLERALLSRPTVDHYFEVSLQRHRSTQTEFEDKRLQFEKLNV